VTTAIFMIANRDGNKSNIQIVPRFYSVDHLELKVPHKPIKTSIASSSGLVNRHALDVLVKD
jgi:hypothetical protein